MKDADKYWEIRNLMREEGVWACMMNTQIYSAQQLIETFPMSEKLRNLLTEHVVRAQYYFDERILELKNKQ